MPLSNPQLSNQHLSNLNPLSAQTRYECLEVYAEQDAIFGSPNPRYKQSSIYCNAYLNFRTRLVGEDGLTDMEWDLTIF